MPVNLELYKVFYYTAREQSFSRAAEELFISQPAVSQAIKQLEEILGGPLFLRNPRGVRLTREGEVLYRYIEQAYTLIQAGEKKIGEMNQLMAGEIRIGASDTFCKYYLVPYLEAFHVAYPEVKIIVANDTTPGTIKLLKSGKIDLGIISLPMEDDQLQVRRGLQIQDCFVVGKKYKHLAEREINIKEIVNYPILLLEEGTNTRKFIDAYAAQHGVELKPDFELASIDLLVQFAKIGLGITLVIRDFIAEELKSGELYEICLQEKIPRRSMGIVTAKNFPLSKAGEKLISLFDLDELE